MQLNRCWTTLNRFVSPVTGAWHESLGSVDALTPCSPSDPANSAGRGAQQGGSRMKVPGKRGSWGGGEGVQNLLPFVQDLLPLASARPWEGQPSGCLPPPQQPWGPLQATSCPIRTMAGPGAPRAGMGAGHHAGPRQLCCFQPKGPFPAPPQRGGARQGLCMGQEEEGAERRRGWRQVRVQVETFRAKK